MQLLLSNYKFIVNLLYIEELSANLKLKQCETDKVINKKRYQLRQIVISTILISLFFLAYNLQHLKAQESKQCENQEITSFITSNELLEWISDLIGKFAFWEIELHNFSTDGCSSFPEGTPNRPNLWLHCCVIHDVAYFAGGRRFKRIAADKALNKCVKEASGKSLSDLLDLNNNKDGSQNPIMKEINKKLKKHENRLGDVMEMGVFVGGSAFIPSTWRWSYGWTAGKNYQKLTKEDKIKVKEKIRQYFQKDCRSDHDVLTLIGREKSEESKKTYLDKVCDTSRLESYLAAVD
ncbi:MAG: hypothetical protein ISR65_16995 [Bacteriovoracaceae bacterium]|nr:hypothetical protein [Bacteriovoracaceae bacterium]